MFTCSSSRCSFSADKQRSNWISSEDSTGLEQLYLVFPIWEEFITREFDTEVASEVQKNNI